MKIIKQSITHISTTPDALATIERAARMCYASKMTRDPEFIRRLIKKGHETPLEFAQAAFAIVTDRGIMAELTRHRLASFCVESTRYVKYRELEFILPDGLDTETQRPAFMAHLHEVERFYRASLEARIAPQVARDVLPLCTATRLRVTANFREWRHILRLRTASGAHPKMRELAGMILEWFRVNFPVVVEDIGTKEGEK